MTRGVAAFTAILLIVLSAAGVGFVRAAQTHTMAPDAALATILTRPVPLRDGIGRAHDPVTTSSPRAQAFYDQGIAYLHSYVWIEAARSFNQALRIDSNLAMANLGLSYALGELGLPAEAREASHKAEALAANITERERQ